MSISIVREHERLPEHLDVLVPAQGVQLPAQEAGLDRAYVTRGWDANEGRTACYASYVIGAQWLSEDQALVVTPKRDAEAIDFLRMFDACLSSDLTPESFGRLYHIDIDAKPIAAPQLESVLSPLIVVHFLSVMEPLVKRGLRRQYVERQENLPKVKGRIDVRRNERLNVMHRRYDRLSCRYTEYSVDTPENRLLRRALVFARAVLSNPRLGDSRHRLLSRTGVMLAAFQGVSDTSEHRLPPPPKQNKLYPEYAPALALARTLLQRYDLSLSNIADEALPVPPFWVDMSMLYEHYVLALLRHAYGSAIAYQVHGRRGERPDFTYHADGERFILDTKYIPRCSDDSQIGIDIVRQLSGYARNRGILKHLGISKGDAVPVVPCVIIYPLMDAPDVNIFLRRPLRELFEAIDDYAEFYKIAVPLPCIKSEGIADGQMEGE